MRKIAVVLAPACPLAAWDSAADIDDLVAWLATLK